MFNKLTLASMAFIAMTGFSFADEAAPNLVGTAECPSMETPDVDETKLSEECKAGRDKTGDKANQPGNPSSGNCGAAGADATVKGEQGTTTGSTGNANGNNGTNNGTNN